MRVGRKLTGYFMKYSKNKLPKILILYVSALVFFFASALSALVLGSADIGIRDIVNALAEGNMTSPEARIFIYVRFPRVCASLLCGAAFSVSGAVIQNVLANRLASPSIIGVNSGAGLAVTLCASIGVIGGWQTSLAAFVGAFVAVTLISAGARKWGSSGGTVILLGVAMNALFGAVSDTVITFDPAVGIMSNDFRIGDFSAVTYVKLIPAAVIISVSLAVLFFLSSELEILTLGEENAKGLGLNTGAVSAVFLILSALLAGSAVSIAGMLSFVGLLVPHAVRRVSFGLGRHLLPLCALFGAGFVTVCDTVARTAFAPYELPVGIIMAFLGAPFFTFILIKGKGGHGNA